jgi:hypothetical protein
MNKFRFDKAFGQFIRPPEEKITPKTFSQVLTEIEQERAQKTIEVRARIVGGQLQFEPSSEVQVQGNEILVGKQRIAIRLS